MTLVVDASVLIMALADDGGEGAAARGRLRGEALTAPHLIDLEVASALRTLTARGALTERRASAALRDLSDLPLQRAPHAPLLPRVWALRGTLTPYDAAYVALAEALEAPLLTADRRLAKAPGPRCPIEVLR